MNIKQIKYNHRMKFVFPLFGLLIIYFGYRGYSNIYPNISMWDYEGFSIMKTSLLIYGFLFLIDGLYNIHINDKIEFGEEGFSVPSTNQTIPYNEVRQVVQNRSLFIIQTSKGNFNIVNLFVSNQHEIEKMLFEDLKFKLVSKMKLSIFLYTTTLLMLIFPPMLLQDHNPDHQKIKFFLPLKKIATTEIEATIKRKATISLSVSEDGIRRSSVAVHGGLKEFPNIHFNYDSFSLPESIVNISDSDSEATKTFNEKYVGNLEKMQRLPEGTKVKLKIRTKDFEDLNKFMLSDEYLSIPKEEFRISKNIKFYELSIDDVIVVQKMGLL